MRRLIWFGLAVEAALLAGLFAYPFGRDLVRLWHDLTGPTTSLEAVWVIALLGAAAAWLGLLCFVTFRPKGAPFEVLVTLGKDEKDESFGS